MIAMKSDLRDSLKGFRVFPDGRGHWCADKDDGTVSGIFFSRTAAIRFARKENDYDLALKSGAVLPDLMTEERF